MGIERRQGTVYQLSLLEWGEEAVRPGVPGEGGTGTGANEEQQGPTASERKRALPEALMEEVIEPKNLNRACQRVKANKGEPGVDGMSVDDLGGWLAEHREELVASLLEGSYQPQPVRGVEILRAGLPETTEVIQESFRDYYRTTILSDETDPDKLHDLKGGLDQAQVYSQEEIDDLVQKYLAGEERSTIPERLS